MGFLQSSQIYEFGGTAKKFFVPPKLWTRFTSLAIAEGPRDALSLLKSYILSRVAVYQYSKVM